MTRKFQTKKWSIFYWHESGSDRKNPKNLKLETGHEK